MPADDPRLLIASLGNPLMGDDGIGPAVLDRLTTGPPLPHSVHLADLGSDSLLLPAVWAGEPRIWLVDALVGEAAPGTIHRLDHDELFTLPTASPSAHHQSLAVNLRWILHCFPSMAEVRFRLWAIEPESVAPCPELSATARRGVAAMVRSIRSELP
jgi:hydrogenase maturation protease